MTGRLMGVAALMVLGTAAWTGAQSLGTFRWQLRPFCNVVTVAVTQVGGVFRVEGTDDQCGSGAPQASVTGTAFQNPDGTIGFGLNIVTPPGGAPVHVTAAIAVGSLSGTWRDSAGGSGSYVFTSGAGISGSPRPLPSPSVPATILLREDGGLVAAGTPGVGTIPASGQGARMMWHPRKAAFRAGFVSSDNWDDQQVGDRSTAFGSNSLASGFGSIATGSATVASGSASAAMGEGTLASGPESTALGLATKASGQASTAMGFDTRASGFLSTAMGSGTTASGSASTAIGAKTKSIGAASFAGGQFAEAAGDTAFAFGEQSLASGRASVGLGTRAHAVGNGSFVFADGSSTGFFNALGPNEFNVRASGGVQMFSNPAASLGVALAPNATQWTSLSDVRSKHLFRDLDGEAVLAKLAQMPVSEWSYKEQDAAIRHIGPTAQDFRAAFGLGEDPLRIGTLDADGVALAGIKALEARTNDLPAVRALVDSLRSEVAALRQRLDLLERR